MIERGDPLFVPSFHKTSDVSTFKIFRFVAVGSFTADSSLLQPTGGVNTTTSHVHFRSVNLYKEFSYRLKVNKFGALTTSELVSRHTERQAKRSSDANQHEGIMN